MTREQKAEIARRNGAKSKGPRTEAGKKIVSRNAVKHGRYSSVAFDSAVRRAVAPHEDPEAFRRLARRNLEHFRPATSFERDIVLAIADTQWRYERWNKSETIILNSEHRGIIAHYDDLREDGVDHNFSEEELHARAARALAVRSDFLKRLTAERTRLMREFSQHFRTLRMLRSEFPKLPKQTRKQTKVQTREQTNVLEFPNPANR